MDLLPLTHRIAEQAYLILIVRIRVDRHGQLVYGEVCDLDTRVCGRFVDWKTLVEIIETCLPPET